MKRELFYIHSPKLNDGFNWLAAACIAFCIVVGVLGLCSLLSMDLAEQGHSIPELFDGFMNLLDWGMLTIILIFVALLTITFYSVISNSEKENRMKQQQEISAAAVSKEHPAMKEYCIYICRDKLQEQGIYTLDEFEDMLANASKGIASDFAAFLKRYKEQGILDFMGHSKRKIFDYFRAHYPEMRAYDYPNFAAAY